MYSKAYQTVTAGRVREDEAIAFFGDNKVATPARVTSFSPQGGSPTPHLEIDPLNHEGVGKPGTESDVIDAYVNPPCNLS